MPQNEVVVTDASGVGPSRFFALGALLLSILVVFPLALRNAASTGRADMASAGILVPVLRAVGVAADVSAVPDTSSGSVAAGPVVESVKADARVLLSLFQEKDYRIDDVRSGDRPVPRLVLAGLPPDIETLEDTQDRKALFVKTMLPLVLLVNERIEKDRARLLQFQAARGEDRAISPKAISPKDRVWLNELAARYGVDAAKDVDIGELLRRVDAVPPSLALAQAAEESGWGTSRFAQAGNALFGQLTWSPKHEGIVPRNRRPGETHRFRSFHDLLSSVESYIHNLNTHDAYAEFRHQRAGLRTQGKPLDGFRLAGTLLRYSERGPDYVQAIRTVIRNNALTDFDRAALHKEPGQVILRITAGKSS